MVNSPQRQTGSWRQFRPVLHREKCTRCWLCFVWCPEAAISLDADDYPVVDYTVCKGCLLCAHECPTQAFSIEKEGGAERRRLGGAPGRCRLHSDDVEVVVVAGDGSTYDMALSATSGAIFRGLDFWYFCYDNESYGNTGMQMSSATPYGARTATTPVSAGSRAGTEHGKKDLFAIWQAHHPAYLATVSPRYPVDLTNKFLKAKTRRGPKLFIAHAPCPTGWLYDPEHTAEYARLAVESGIFALKEAIDGVVTHTYVPRRRRPVEAYLHGQGRYRHLFEPVRNEAAIQQIQGQIDQYWAAVTDTGR
jgi:2-oxoacid:acceptor oxidoreductase delta subunit (pyruvate/2-ketoisovalerate family)